MTTINQAQPAQRSRAWEMLAEAATRPEPVQAKTPAEMLMEAATRPETPQAPAAPFPGFIQATANQGQQGVLDVLKVGSVVRLLGGSDDAAPDDIAALQIASRQFPETAGQRQIGAAQGLIETVSAYARNPGEIVGQAARSLIPAIGVGVPMGLAGGAAGSLAGPGGTAIGAAAGIGGSSAITSGTLQILDLLEQNGVDTTNPQAIRAAKADPVLWPKVRNAAAAYGLTVGAFDAASAGVAGKVAGVAQKAVGGAARPRASMLAGGLADKTAQGFMGGAGEVAGAVASGQEIDAKNVHPEIFGEFAGAGFERGTYRAAGRMFNPAGSDGSQVPAPVSAVPPASLPGASYQNTSTPETARSAQAESVGQVLPGLSPTVSLPSDPDEAVSLFDDVTALGQQDGASGSQPHQFAGMPPEVQRAYDLAYRRAQRDAEPPAPSQTPTTMPEALPAADQGTSNPTPDLPSTIVAPDAPAPGTTFTTAKGSTYTVNPDGSTTRNKAQRPEHGSDAGMKPSSSWTVYLTDEQLNALDQVAATFPDGSKPHIVRDPQTGRVAVGFAAGPRAGTVIPTTIVNPGRSPAVGLHPLEVWENAGSRNVEHFGNKITALESSNATPPTQEPSNGQETEGQGQRLLSPPEQNPTPGANYPENPDGSAPAAGIISSPQRQPLRASPAQTPRPIPGTSSESAGQSSPSVRPVPPTSRALPNLTDAPSGSSNLPLARPLSAPASGTPAQASPPTPESTPAAAATSPVRGEQSLPKARQSSQNTEVQSASPSVPRSPQVENLRARGEQGSRLAASLDDLTDSGTLAPTTASLMADILAKYPAERLAQLDLKRGRVTDDSGQTRPAMTEPTGRGWAITFSDGLAGRNPKADPDTKDFAVALEETAHFGYETVLTASQQAEIGRIFKETKADRATRRAMNKTGLADTREGIAYGWSNEAEFFARQFVEYVLGRKAPVDPSLIQVFKEFAKRVADAIARLAGRGSREQAVFKKLEPYLRAVATGQPVPEIDGPGWKRAFTIRGLVQAAIEDTRDIRTSAEDDIANFERTQGQEFGTGYNLNAKGKMPGELSGASPKDRQTMGRKRGTSGLSAADSIAAIGEDAFLGIIRKAGSSEIRQALEAAQDDGSVSGRAALARLILEEYAQRDNENRLPSLKNAQPMRPDSLPDGSRLSILGIPGRIVVDSAGTYFQTDTTRTDPTADPFAGEAGTIKTDGPRVLVSMWDVLPVENFQPGTGTTAGAQRNAMDDQIGRGQTEGPDVRFARPTGDKPETSRTAQQVNRATGVTTPKGEKVTTTERAGLKKQLSQQAKVAAEAFKAGKMSQEERAAKIESVRQRVERITGQGKPEEATKRLRRSLKQQARASREGYRAGRREATAKAKAELAEIRATLGAKAKQTAQTARDVKKALIGVITRNIKPADRGRFLSAVSKAKTFSDLIRARKSVQSVMLKRTGKLARARVLAMTSKSDLKKLTNDRRNQIRGILDGAQSDMDRFKRATPGTRQRFSDKQLAESAVRIEQAERAIGAIIAEHKAETARIKGGKGLTMAAAKSQIVGNLAKMKDRPLDENGNPTDLSVTQKARSLFNVTDNMAELVGKIEGVASEKSALYTIMVEDPRRGESEKLARMRDLREGMDAAARTAGYDGLVDAQVSAGLLGESLTQRATVKLGAKDRRVKIGQLMAMLAHSTDPSTRAIWAKGFGFVWRGGPNRAADVIYTDLGELSDALATLTEGQRKAVEMGKALIASVNPEVQRVMRRLVGYELETTEGYYSRARAMELSGRQADADLGDLGGGQLVMKIAENASIAQARGVDTKTPFVIGDFWSDLETYFEAATQIAYMAEPLRNAIGIVKDPEIVQAIAKKHGPKAHPRMKTMLAAFTGAENPETPLGKLVAWLNSARAKALLSLNPNTMLLQQAGITRMLDRYSPAEMAAAAGDAARITIQEMSEVSGYFDHRYNGDPALRMVGMVEGGGKSAGFRRAMGAVLANLTQGNFRDAWKALQRAFSALNLLSKAESNVAKTALAIERRRAKAAGLRGQAAERAAVLAAENAIRETQNASSTLDQSYANIKTRRTGGAAFTLFTSDTQTQLSRIKRARRDGGAAGMARAIASELPSIMAATGLRIAGVGAIVGLIAAGLSGNDDEFDRRWRAMTDPSNWVKAAGANVAGLAMPLGGQAVADITRKTLDGKGNTRFDAATDTPSATIDFVIGSANRIQRAAETGSAKDIGKVVYETLLPGIGFPGMPILNIGRQGLKGATSTPGETPAERGRIIDEAAGASSPEAAARILVPLLRGKSFAERSDILEALTRRGPMGKLSEKEQAASLQDMPQAERAKANADRAAWREKQQNALREAAKLARGEGTAP